MRCPSVFYLAFWLITPPLASFSIFKRFQALFASACPSSQAIVGVSEGLATFSSLLGGPS
jgi:hypothetical protein